MRPKRAQELAKSLLPDIDGVLAGQSRPIEDRHSAAASATLTVARLLGGFCVNVARIADALDDIANQYVDGVSSEDTPDDGPTNKPDSGDCPVPPPLADGP